MVYFKSDHFDFISNQLLNGDHNYIDLLIRSVNQSSFITIN